MEQIMGQIEQDILYGDDAQPPGTSPPPALKLSPTGVITRGPQPPAGTPPITMPKSGVLTSVIDFMKKPAGPLPVWGWGAIVGTTAAVITTAVVMTRKPY